MKLTRLMILAASAALLLNGAMPVQAQSNSGAPVLHRPERPERPERPAHPGRPHGPHGPGHP